MNYGRNLAKGFAAAAILILLTC